MGELLVVPDLSGDLTLAVIQPRPFELRAVFVGTLGFTDPHSRKVTDWVRGKLHSGDHGNFIEWYQQEQDGEFLVRREAYEAHSGQVIVQWPDGSYQVLSPDEYKDLFIQVGTEMWSDPRRGRGGHADR